MANRGMPSLLALLGLVAAAGFQNRDKIADALKGANGGNALGGNGPAGDARNTLSDAGNVVGQTANSIGATLSNGLNELLATFRDAGQKDTADSWVTVGVPTQTLNRDQVEQAIGRDTLAEVAAKSGLDYDELLERLSKDIPETVDRLTPEGKFPQNDDEVRSRILGS
jgi:uncharacterized protein YidB (DUF937 family)